MYWGMLWDDNLELNIYIFENCNFTLELVTIPYWIAVVPCAIHYHAGCSGSTLVLSLYHLANR